MVERNHRMELQYDGTGLHGWARQDGLQTVEGCLGEALRTVLGYAPDLHVAGRTDAGVHARRQVASLRLPDGLDLGKFRHSLNALTPAGIAVTEVRRVSASFDARVDAISRCYRYFICTDPVVSPFWVRYCWHVHGSDLDLHAVKEAAALVAGRHRFTAFTPTETEHMFFDRTVLRCRWTRTGGAALQAPVLGSGGSETARRERADRAVDAGRGRGEAPGGILCLEVEADAFLRHMVRTLVGTMMEVGRGERSLEDFRGLLDGGRREAAGPTAPPWGLFLWDVGYGRGGPKRPPCGRIPAERRGGAAGPACGPASAGDGAPTKNPADREA